ncbi:MAG: PaaI family thioesterase [Firmicutes bacterium]|nr:PaaI family thioesterase [Bacillota bacterium]
MTERPSVFGLADTDKLQELEPSAGCFVCDPDNPGGLGIRFYTDGQAAYAEHALSEAYQGYDGMVHGGVLVTLLDEVMAKALAVHGISGVTGKLEVRFRKPASIGAKLSFKGWVKSRRRKSCVVASEIRAADGDLLVEAEGLFLEKADGSQPLKSV